MLRERRNGHVTWLTFDSPERLNSFTVADYHDFRVALERAVADRETHVIVLTGSGRAFSAGADRSLLDPSSTVPDRARAGDEFAELLRVLGECEKPLLAAVNGLAVGFGCTMLLYCDLVIAGESARFRLPFSSLGMVPEAGSSVLLPARVRWDEGMWALLSSEWIDVATARDMGLVWRVARDDSLFDEVQSKAASLATVDPASVAATKRLINAGRADAVQRAIERELAEMSRLLPGDAPSNSNDGV